MFVLIWASFFGLLLFIDTNFMIFGKSKMQTNLFDIFMNITSVNTSKTEFMIFGKSKRKDFNEQIIIDSIPIDEKPEVKYLGVRIHSNLTFQEEVKHILRNMARGIKTIYAIGKSILQKLLILVLNALVSSHLHYSAVIIHGIEQNLIMSWKTA